MFKKFFNIEISDLILKSALIGITMGFLTIFLSENNETIKQRIKEIISAIFFAIFIGLIMHHLKSLGYASTSLELATIGFVSYNQNPIKKMLQLVFNSFISAPFDTIKKIKEALK